MSCSVYTNDQHDELSKSSPLSARRLCRSRRGGRVCWPHSTSRSDGVVHRLACWQSLPAGSRSREFRVFRARAGVHLDSRPLLDCHVPGFLHILARGRDHPSSRDRSEAQSCIWKRRRNSLLRFGATSPDADTAVHPQPTAEVIILRTATGTLSVSASSEE